MVLFAGSGGCGCEKFLLVVPVGRTAPSVIPILLPYIAGIRRAEEFEKIKLEQLRVNLTEDLIHVVDLWVPLLIDDHAIEKLHVRAPTRDGLQALLSVANFCEEFQALVTFGLWSIGIGAVVVH